MRDRPIFAGFYEVLSRGEDRFIQRYRRELVQDAVGRVLEVGAGNGLNLPRYRREASVVALEPEPTMLKNARRRVEQAAAAVRPVRASAERLPFRPRVFDTVVFSLVLCTIPDPGLALAEARRVLAPDGEIRFFEHVRATEPRLARRQDRLNRAYGVFAGGCNMNRDTLGELRRAGLRVRYRRLAYGPRMAPHVIGVAARP